MKNLVALLSFLFLIESIPIQARSHHAQWFSGEVVGVSDGDTISVMHNGRAEKIRLYGIDCPEKRQDYGKQAKIFTSQACFGQIVTIDARTQDRYGRTIGVVILPNRRSLNHELVRNGMAWWYRQYAPKDRSLKDLEMRARKYRVGLWFAPNPIPPWEFRHPRKHY